MYKLAAIDLDGTMLNQYGIVTQRTKEAIKKVQQQGIEVVIASRRPTDSVKTIEKEIELLQKENNELRDKITFGENFSKGLEQEIEKTEKDTKSLLNKKRRL